MAQKPMPSRECRREHKHYDVPHDAIDRRHQQGAEQIPDTHEKRCFQDAEGGVFKPCQQRKGIQQNDAVQNCCTNKHCSEQRPENVFAHIRRSTKPSAARKLPTASRISQSFVAGLKFSRNAFKKHPGQTIVPKAHTSHKQVSTVSQFRQHSKQRLCPYWNRSRMGVLLSLNLLWTRAGSGWFRIDGAIVQRWFFDAGHKQIGGGVAHDLSMDMDRSQTGQSRKPPDCHRSRRPSYHREPNTPAHPMP